MVKFTIFSKIRIIIDYSKCFRTFMVIKDSVKKLMRILKRRGLKPYDLILDDEETDGKKIKVKRVIAVPIRKDYRESVSFIISEETLTFIERLKKSNLKVMTYIMKNLQKDNDEIFLNATTLSKMFNADYSNTVKAISELVEDGWIYPDLEIDNKYMINLMRFSKGDVSAIINKYDAEIRREELQKEINEQIDERRERNEDR